MTVFIRYSSQAYQKVLPLVEKPKLWEMDVHEALVLSKDDTLVADSHADAAGIDVDKVSLFVAIFISALPREPNYGKLSIFAKQFLQRHIDAKRIDILVGLSNYLFKSLALEAKDCPDLLLERVLRITHELHYFLNIEIHRIRSQDASYYALADSLNKMELALPNSDLVVFVFLTQAYINNLPIWLKIYSQHDLRGERLFILTVGQEPFGQIDLLLARMGLDRAKTQHFNPGLDLQKCGNGMSLNFAWYLKVNMSRRIVAANKDVIYSDLDAYWVRNYVLLDRKIGNNGRIPDVTISATFDMPKSVVSKWGFTLCAGFFSCRATTAGRSFLADWERMTEVMYDDQIALAQVFLNRNAQWKSTLEAITTHETSILTDGGVFATVGILDTDVAKRVGPPDITTIGAATIWHPRWVIAPEAHADVADILRSTSVENS